MSTGKNGKVVSINLSPNKGTGKTPVPQARFRQDWGVEGDAHAAPGIRQVSLLAFESIQKQQVCPQVQKKGIALQPGDFGENLTTAGLPLAALPVGTRLKVGPSVRLEISKIGKECHRYCSIYYKTGDCIMPREGVFAVVIDEGMVTTGDTIEVLA